MIEPMNELSGLAPVVKLCNYSHSHVAVMSTQEVYLEM